MGVLAESFLGIPHGPIGQASLKRWLVQCEHRNQYTWWFKLLRCAGLVIVYGLYRGIHFPSILSKSKYMVTVPNLLLPLSFFWKFMGLVPEV